MSTVIDNYASAAQPRSLRVPSAVRLLKWTAPIALICLGAFAWQRGWFGFTRPGPSADLLLYEVYPRDLPITVIERGNLESQTNVPVYCEVEDVRSDGISGTPIVWIIENGSSVSKGDLICEFDSTAIQSELDEQILDTEEARSAHVQARANLDNQAIENQTAKYKAELDVKLAELELAMFEDAKAGSHTLALEAIHRQIDDLNNEILAAQMSLKLRKNEMQGIDSLYKLGYAGKSELDRSELSYLQAEGDYAAKLNKLQTHVASLEKLEKFDKKMQTLELMGKLETAKQASRQVELTNEAKLAQMEGIMSSRTEQLTKEEERLQRYQDQLRKCKLYAPQDGMVTYATPRSSRDSEIVEGVPVRPRQLILSIPNLRAMQVVTKIHESVLDQVQPGLKVSVEVDAIPGKTFTGTVKSVAVLPATSYYSDIKTYETTIVIDEEVYQLKPGMTAVCEINVSRQLDVNAVPIQAVVQRDGTSLLFVEKRGSIERREVTLGESNDQLVCVVEGIEVGEKIVLNPGALTESESNAPNDKPEKESASLVASAL